MPPPSTLCAESKAGRFDIVWGAFDGTVFADQEMDSIEGPTTADNDSARGATLTATSYLAAGQDDLGPLALVHVERGRVDVIDSNPNLALETRVYAVRGGAITLSPQVPRGLRILDLRDVDGDGRSDLLTPGPFEAKVPNVHGTAVYDHGPLLVAHAGPNGYSMTDHVAVAHGLRLCPSRPTRLALPRVSPDGWTHD